MRSSAAPQETTCLVSARSSELPRSQRRLNRFSLVFMILYVALHDLTGHFITYRSHKVAIAP